LPHPSGLRHCSLLPQPPFGLPSAGFLPSAISAALRFAPLDSGFDMRPSSREHFPMLDLATASHTQFEPSVGQTFELATTTVPIPLTLAEARRAGPAHTGAARDPFVLTFHGAPALRLPQGIYRLENATLGTMEIFLVQVAADATASHIEAVFS
jgi:hypothetical protein